MVAFGKKDNILNDSKFRQEIIFWKLNSTLLNWDDRKHPLEIHFNNSSMFFFYSNIIQCMIFSEESEQIRTKEIVCTKEKKKINLFITLIRLHITQSVVMRFFFFHKTASYQITFHNEKFHFLEFNFDWARSKRWLMWQNPMRLSLFTK